MTKRTIKVTKVENGRYVEVFINGVQAGIKEFYDVNENIYNNNDIINHLLKKTPVLWKCPMAYFLYNFAYRPFFSSDVFLIN